MYDIICEFVQTDDIADCTTRFVVLKMYMFLGNWGGFLPAPDHP